jgi:hypothetical protein
MGKLHRIRKAFNAGVFDQERGTRVSAEVHRRRDGERRVNVGWWCERGYRKFITKLRQERADKLIQGP